MKGMDMYVSLDPRRSDRPLIELAAIVGQPRTGRRFTAEVVEISCEGCRMLTGEPMTYGDQVLDSVPGLARWPARVVWARSGTAGVEFHRSLKPDAVAHFVAAFPPELWTYGQSRRQPTLQPAPDLAAPARG